MYGRDRPTAHRSSLLPSDPSDLRTSCESSSIRNSNAYPGGDETAPLTRETPCSRINDPMREEDWSENVFVPWVKTCRTPSAHSVESSLPLQYRSMIGNNFGRSRLPGCAGGNCAQTTLRL